MYSIFSFLSIFIHDSNALPYCLLLGLLLNVRSPKNPVSPLRAQIVSHNLCVCVCPYHGHMYIISHAILVHYMLSGGAQCVCVLEKEICVYP